MVTKQKCKGGGDTLPNGNCTNLGPDNLPVQCVGQWATDKHFYLQKYVEATRAVRARYLEPEGARPAGGAAFVDLFAGPGRARVRETGEIIDGSPLVALGHDEAPFTHVILCELLEVNAQTLTQRTAQHRHRTSIIVGDCNEVIDEVIAKIPPHGLNIALVDPFNLQPLCFDTLARLASVKRMDLVVHFPTNTIKRSLHADGTKALLDRFLGTTSWRDLVTLPDEVVRLIEVLREQLGSLGYGTDAVRALPVRNTQNVVMYHLVFASKHDRGDKIWNSIARGSPSGQRSFGF